MRDVQRFIWGKQDKSHREDKVGLVVRMMNIRTGERIFRFVIGAVLIALALFISGTFGWILGFIGVAVIPTAIFGY
jgi:hypothetical protein